ncbi:hypothetical protein [Paenibacillus sp. RC84]|uniref:hypothetical protein n=1 Tax=Paenibacillus sp. RC84 TaxID=3156252 RepID=UPI003513916C
MVEQHVPVRPISSVIPTKRYAERGAGKGFFDLLGLSMTVSDGRCEPFQPLSSLGFYLKNEYPARRRDGFLRAYRPNGNTPGSMAGSTPAADLFRFFFAGVFLKKECVNHEYGEKAVRLSETGCLQ